MTDEMRKDGFNTNNSRKLSAVLTFFRAALGEKEKLPTKIWLWESTKRKERGFC